MATLIEMVFIAFSVAFAVMAGILAAVCRHEHRNK